MGLGNPEAIAECWVHFDIMYVYRNHSIQNMHLPEAGIYRYNPIACQLPTPREVVKNEYMKITEE